MCISNLNANISLFPLGDNGEINSNDPVKILDKIRCGDDDFFIRFTIVLNMNLVSSSESSKNKESNVLNQKGKLLFKIRLINIINEDKFYYAIIDEDNLNFSNDSLIVEQLDGVKFCNYRKSIPVSKMALLDEFTNNFGIQLLVSREINGNQIDSKDIIQTMYKFKVE